MARPKSDIERVQTGVRLQPEIIKALRHLSIDLDKPLNVLLEEAAEDLLVKYGYEPPSVSPPAPPQPKKK